MVFRTFRRSWFLKVLENYPPSQLDDCHHDSKFYMLYPWKGCSVWIFITSMNIINIHKNIYFPCWLIHRIQFASLAAPNIPKPIGALSPDDLIDAESGRKLNEILRQMGSDETLVEIAWEHFSREKDVDFASWKAVFQGGFCVSMFICWVNLWILWSILKKYGQWSKELVGKTYSRSQKWCPLDESSVIRMPWVTRIGYPTNIAADLKTGVKKVQHRHVGEAKPVEARWTEGCEWRAVWLFAARLRCWNLLQADGSCSHHLLVRDGNSNL